MKDAILQRATIPETHVMRGLRDCLQASQCVPNEKCTFRVAASRAAQSAMGGDDDGGVATIDAWAGIFSRAGYRDRTA